MNRGEGMIWKDKYKLGVKLIDEQHKELFEKVTNFVEVVRKPIPWEEKLESINETLDFMKNYVVTHFRDEEAFQKKIGYAGYEAHKKVHDDMVKFVLDTEAKYINDGYNEQLMQQFAGKLLAWLINHVLSDDQKIAAFAREKGVEGFE